MNIKSTATAAILIAASPIINQMPSQGQTIPNGDYLWCQQRDEQTVPYNSQSPLVNYESCLSFRYTDGTVLGLWFEPHTSFRICIIGEMDRYLKGVSGQGVEYVFGLSEPLDVSHRSDIRVLSQGVDEFGDHYYNLHYKSFFLDLDGYTSVTPPIDSSNKILPSSFSETSECQIAVRIYLDEDYPVGNH